MEKKMLQIVGGLLILGFVLYLGVTWIVFPDTGVEENDISTTSDGIENGGTDTAATEDSEDETEPVSTGCEVSDTEPGDNYSGIGPPFDGRVAEKRVHEALNGIRETRSNGSAEDLNCDREVSEVAQEHSKAMSELGFLGETPASDGVKYGNVTDRYEGVCENPREMRGRFLYQRDKNLNWDGPRLTQEDNIIKDHKEFSDDVRRVWSDKDRAVEALTDKNVTRQGVGVYMNRPSGVVYVTHTVC